jgi:predicted CXXCH cytochrome family protein
MMKNILVAAVLAVLAAPAAWALDRPHDLLDCSDCHTSHGTGGPGLGLEGNANVCISCHNTGVPETSHNFSFVDQAVPGYSGTSHSWSAVIDPATCFPATCGPDSRYGVRKPDVTLDTPPEPDEIQSLELNNMMFNFDNVVTCSVCHQQHNQSGASWDPFKEDLGTATGGTGTTLTDDTKAWTSGQWVDYFVSVATGDIRQITASTTDTLTVDPAFSASVTGEAYTIYGGNFMRVDNDINQLCEDCHYYRTISPHTDVRTYDGLRKSHPIAAVFSNASGETPTVPDLTIFNPAPLEHGVWTQQTGRRYRDDGTGDTNLTNNLVVDGEFRIRCLTCHGVHFTDSDVTTVDGP